MMPDISMCSGQWCPMRNSCYRHRAIPLVIDGEDCQAWGDFSPKRYPHPWAEDRCNYFWAVKYAQNLPLMLPPERKTDDVD